MLKVLSLEHDGKVAIWTKDRDRQSKGNMLRQLPFPYRRRETSDVEAAVNVRVGQ